ncbi:MAG: small multi-drug export protein [Lachnospiraceae bacterium]|nr:small multi-drug export protein [Lachnospiraceae bacterium]
MDSLVNWYNASLGSWLPKEVFIFFVSMLPFIELRGGLVVAWSLKIPMLTASLICIAGNLLPIPFILFFIKAIFKFMKEHNILKKLVLKLEERASRKSAGVEKGEFIFLLLFVGIPIPGTGAWMGSLIASLFEFNIKKAFLAILLGVLMAAVIVNIISYGLLENLVG